jgi:hypothetical protein
MDYFYIKINGLMFYVGLRWMFVDLVSGPPKAGVAGSIPAGRAISSSVEIP